MDSNLFTFLLFYLFTFNGFRLFAFLLLIGCGLFFTFLPFYLYLEPSVSLVPCNGFVDSITELPFWLIAQFLFGKADVTTPVTLF